MGNKGRYKDSNPLLSSDLPIDRPGLVVHHELVLGGWAASPRGIASVVVQIDGARRFQASYGLDTPWLTESLDGLPGADAAGFRLRLDTSEWTRGIHAVRLIALDEKKRRSEIGGQVEVVPFEQPRYTVEDNLAAIAAGEPVMWLEEPRLVDRVPELSGALELGGWAYSPRGIESVVVTVDQRARHEALRPISRPDLLADYGPEVAGEAGFFLRLDRFELPPGTHTIGVVALARDGKAVGLEGKVRSAEPAAATAAALQSPPVEWMPDRTTPRLRESGSPPAGASEQVREALASALMWEDRARLAEADAAASRAQVNLAQMHQKGAVGKLREAEARALDAEALEASLSWRITRPLRSFKRRLSSLRATK